MKTIENIKHQDLKNLSFSEIEALGIENLFEKFDLQDFPKEFFFTIFEKLETLSQFSGCNLAPSPARDILAIILRTSDFPKKDFLEIQKMFYKMCIKSANFHFIYYYYNEYGFTDETEDYILNQPDLVEILESFDESSILDSLHHN